MTAAGVPGGNDAAPSDGGAGATTRRGGPPAWFIVLAVGSLLVAVFLTLLPMLGIGVRIGSTGDASPAPAGAAADRTHTLVWSALESAGLQVTDPQTAYRPGESPTLATAPRRLVQATLPDDPQNGYVVIYEFPSASAADAAGKEYLQFVAKGSGALEYPKDTQFVVQRVGSTLVVYTWSPSVSPTGGAAQVARAVATVGEPVRP